MTTWPCPALPPGSFGLPGPALMLPEWTLTALLEDPTAAGFTKLDLRRGWSETGPAAAGVVLDLHQEASPILLGAQIPEAVDADALRDLVPGARKRGGVRWMLPLSLVADAPGTSATLDAAHRDGRIWVVTGEVPRWWQAYRDRPDAPLGLPAAELFGEGGWAAVVPLLARPDEHGVGTRPTPPAL